MESSLKDRIVLVTGGAAGIGRAVALLAAERGASVAVLDRDAQGALAVGTQVVEINHGKALALNVDVSNEAAVAKAFSEIEKQLGVPTAVFAGAGIDRGGPAHELPAETWRRVMNVNLDGVFYTARHAIALLLKHGLPGSIVCASSPAASVGFAAGGAEAYSASKGGISSLVRCLAVDYARYGIRVNAIVPGATETGMMWANADAADVPRLRAQIAAEVPAGRLAQPEEPARAALWLFSDEASYVTGSHLVCDGGILAKASISF
ncbi:MAG TPA: SDR family NAD(P)-dependent oxidoreductase [Bryobacteraceae bacterium]|jgi:NAD(P)-dependent dehydrogenase (short-subunit alcohol dehydrogenase family)|nr:SDR family NAD(P)-dependent oxidoreductase [Bryobacteraceae bacterium]